MKIDSLTPLQTYGEALARLFYPANCGSCRTLLALEEKGICTPCQERVSELQFSVTDAIVSDPPEGIREAWCLYSYAPPVKEILLAIKFMRKRWLMKVFAPDIRAVAASFCSEAQYDAIVPIPISRMRLFQREFNQTELIARIISAQTGIPVERHRLKKNLHIPEQSLLTREEREANPMGAFAAASSAGIEEKTFLLVDDILTTGATVREAARCLKEKGAKRVDLFVLARTTHDKEGSLE